MVYKNSPVTNNKIPATVKEKRGTARVKRVRIKIREFLSLRYVLITARSIDCLMFINGFIYLALTLGNTSVEALALSILRV